MMIRSFAVSAALAALAVLGCVPAIACAQTALTQRISGERFEALAKPAIKHVKLTGDVALVEAFAIPDQTVPAGPVDLVVGTALVNPAFVNVPIEIDVNGKFLRQVFVGYRVQQYVRTAVATHDLVPGAVLTADDLKIERVLYSGYRTNGTDVLVGRRIVNAIRADQPIAIESTQANQIVKPGSTVILIVHDGGVDVVADVVARTGGGLGDEVMLYNPQTMKTLSGTVVGPDRVELSISGETQ